MENDGPVAAVQIRLAKGDITPAQYREIISHLMKNVSSFQQTSSLKILQIRYAKSEITAEQYHEIHSNLMKNLYSHPWSPPLHILHVRYAEGEIHTDQYLEMFTNLTQEQFAYDQSTPLWILNNRFARGELSSAEYEEIITLFTEFTLSLQQATMNPPGGQSSSRSPENSEKKKTSPDIMSGKSSITQSNLPGSALNQPVILEKIVKQEEKPEEITQVFLTDTIITEKIEGTIPTGSISIIETSQETIEDSGTDETGKIATEVFSSAELSKSIQELNPAKNTAVDNSLIVTDAEKSSNDKNSVNDTEKTFISHLGISQKQQLYPHGTSHNFPTPIGSTISSIHAEEGLPSDFLYSGDKQTLGMIAEEAGLPPRSNLRVDYSIAPVSTSGGKTNTYETVTSRISHIDSSKGNLDLKKSDSIKVTDEKGILDVPDIRQKIKTLIVKGDYDEAINLAESMIEDNADDYLPYFYKGMAKYYLNTHVEALQDLDNARGLCKSNDELRKIDTIRNHILNKQKETGNSLSNNNEKITSLDFSEVEESPVSEIPPGIEENSDQPDELSVILDTLGKKAQELINKKEYREADKVLSEFVGYVADLSSERLQTESVDEIYAAMGYVRYQLKDYVKAKECFQNALTVNTKNEVANQFMQDILIKAARKK